ncbi:MAG: helix-hairpin-helix domain-containing protein [Desulfobacterota bacterium]|nr:helix-hairpin-helix domain-containing protein [Thermodesulfobacteriota bacterium]
MKRKAALKEEIKPDFSPLLIGVGILFLLLGGNIIYFFNINTRLVQIVEKFPPYCFEVKGEVSNPGIYFFPSPLCAGEILAIADNGQRTKFLIDPAVTLSSGSSLWAKETSRGMEVKFASIEARNKIILGIPLNLNTATAEEFSAIPGIGLSIGEKIVAFRDIYGNFSNLEELKAIKGIGEKKFKRIKKYIMVNSET